MAAFLLDNPLYLLLPRFSTPNRGGKRDRGVFSARERASKIRFAPPASLLPFAAFYAFVGPHAMPLTPAAIAPFPRLEIEPIRPL